MTFPKIPWLALSLLGGAAMLHGCPSKQAAVIKADAAAAGARVQGAVNAAETRAADREAAANRKSYEAAEEAQDAIRATPTPDDDLVPDLLAAECDGIVRMRDEGDQNPAGGDYGAGAGGGSPPVPEGPGAAPQDGKGQRGACPP